MLQSFINPLHRVEPLVRPFVRPFVRAVYPQRHPDIHSLAQAHGYSITDHQVTTDDGYVLTVHRLSDPENTTAPQGPVVYFHHGLLTNSELFLLGDRRERCLPYILLDKGYDVWLGNNRGNKYSSHVQLDQNDSRYWDFSIDEFATHDIPSIVDYILTTTQRQQLNYIGFSQGTTQLFASLSVNPHLNEKIKLFVGLSPVMVPQPLTHPLIKPFVDNPAHLSTIFGSGPMLPFVDMVNKLIPRHAYKVIVDLSLKLLFNTSGTNISNNQKLTGYPYLYSVSSVKCVMHWFQIIREQSFCKWYNKPLDIADGGVREVDQFMMDRFKVPTLLVYGGSDVLVDMITISKLLKDTHLDVDRLEVSSYEHMDTLWGSDCVEKVFNPVVGALEKANQGDKERELSTAGSVFI